MLPGHKTLITAELVDTLPDMTLDVARTLNINKQIAGRYIGEQPRVLVCTA